MVLRQKISKKIIALAAGALFLGGIFLVYYYVAAGNRSVVTASVILWENWPTYTHLRREFSVKYPKGFTTQTFFESDNTETIVFQRETNEKAGFQIFVSPYEEELKEERIVNDFRVLLHLENFEEIMIGNSVSAFVFNGEDPAIGKTKEVWFSHDGYLYQITAYAHFGDELGRILETWRFAR